MSWLYPLLSPTPASGNNPALFMLEKAELALCAELPQHSQHLQGTVHQVTVCLLFCSLLKGEQSNLCTGARAARACILTRSACTGQCNLSGLKLAALLGAAGVHAAL